MSEQNSHPHLRWTEIDRRTVFDGRIFTILQSKRRSSEGKETDYVLVDSADWCNVVAVVPDQSGVPCFVMARQFRQGSQTVTVEFPGGIVHPTEQPHVAALREFEEETGYTASSLHHIGKVNPNPAFMLNDVFTYWAVDPRPVSAQNLDEHEFIDVELVPVNEVVDLLRPDFHVHAIMLAALHWYTLFVEDRLGYEERLSRWEKE